MTTLQIILLCIAIALAITFILVRVLKGGMLGVIIKTLASLAFIAIGIGGLCTLESKTGMRVGALILVGLILGLCGDILLDLKVIRDNDRIYLNLGMLSFGIGHIFYFSAFTYLATLNKTGLLLPILVAFGGAIILTTGIILSSKLMKLDFGKFLWQTIGYTFILTFMTMYTLMLAFTFGGTWIVFIGMLLFFLSDIVLSFQYFGGKLHSKLHIIVNHLLYYSAQIILAFSIFYIA